jgi:mono/diheme cytochrome c family protein
VIQNGKQGPIEVLGVSYDSVMPAVPALTGADLDAVVAHVVALSGAGTEPGTTIPDSTVVEPPAAGDVDRGHDLFVGGRGLTNGGPACAACHIAGTVGNLGGGGLGPDLTTAYATLGGEAGLTAWLGNPPSPTMAPIYADRPLTDAELADVIAFLATTPDADVDDGPVDGLVLAGLAGLVVLIGGMAIGWRGMGQTYVQRLRSTR